MFSEGNLLYFEPFIFKNGATPKNKYFLVIGNSGGNLLLASLPTSKDHIPSGLPVRAGVYEIPASGVSAYVFLAGQEIASDPCGPGRFAFPRNTFLYGEQIDTYPVLSLEDMIASGSVQARVVGRLDDAVLNEIRQFVKDSCMVRGKFKKLIR